MFLDSMNNCRWKIQTVAVRYSNHEKDLPTIALLLMDD